jgi:hypothetical protein
LTLDEWIEVENEQRKLNALKAAGAPYLRRAELENDESAVGRWFKEQLLISERYKLANLTGDYSAMRFDLRSKVLFTTR